MVNKVFLESAGINYAKGVERFMGDERLYQTVLRAFLTEPVMGRAIAAHDAGDMKTLFSCVHELKGSCGNADIINVYAQACTLVELLRFGAEPSPEIEQSYGKLLAAYNQAQTAIAAELEASK